MEDTQKMRETLAPHWWDMSPWETKILFTLFWFADPVSDELSISLYGLSQKINSRTRDMLPWVQQLKQRGLIDFTPGPNPFLESHFKILPGKPSLLETSPGENDPEIAGLPVDPAEESPPVTDTVTVKRDRSLKQNVPDGNETEKESPATGSNDDSGELTAESMATSLGDLENLALYEAYLQRYPEAIIRKAYHDVLQTPPEKIKKSAGAYFTFLVKKYGETS